uniref:Uncharacterized protein n=1 Tax=Vitrella brassicaformis TaxID=1169539 RepID=A0A7S1KB50_9ALVE|mmetsp:Transcript_46375/g.115383  ORF Transcript_46375/g.115383 Transcript_46375/m.115383 type:complete len:146 (+) Transcript_46375:192-629(+)
MPSARAWQLITTVRILQASPLHCNFLRPHPAYLSDNLNLPSDLSDTAHTSIAPPPAPYMAAFATSGAPVTDTPYAMCDFGSEGKKVEWFDGFKTSVVTLDAQCVSGCEDCVSRGGVRCVRWLRQAGSAEVDYSKCAKDGFESRLL